MSCVFASSGPAIEATQRTRVYSSKQYMLYDWEVITGYHSIGLWSPNQDQTLVILLIRHSTFCLLGNAD